MKRKIEIGTAIFLIMAAVILACLITYTFITTKLTTTFAIADKYTKLSIVEQLVASRYVNDYDVDAAMDSILSGYISAVDPHGRYMNAEAYQQYLDEMNGKYTGLGISVNYVASTGNMEVSKVDRGSSADNAGVKAGDVIYKIDGVDVNTMTEEQARNLLKAKAATTIDLSIYRGEKSLEKKLIFSEYTTTTLEYRVINDNIGYIRFDAFDTITASEFHTAYSKLKSKGVTSFIFDVRNNDGATIESTCEILDVILPKGTIATVQTKGSSKTSTIQSDEDEIKLPIVVLVNQKTQSSAELFAAAIRDYKKGTIVGVTTYGKGVAQQVIPLSDQTAVYLSTQIYFPPSEKSFDGVGVEPDVVVEMSDEDLSNFYELTEKTDVQLAQAISILKSK